MFPAEWRIEIASHQLRCCEDIQHEATENMLVFRLAGISAALDVGELEQFLMDMYRAFLAKAAASGFVGLFYAWFDEMSGTLRCGACRATTAQDLPFSCVLEVFDTAGPIAVEVAKSMYLSVIPTAEFHENEFSDDAVEQEVRLRVFVRPLLRVV